MTKPLRVLIVEDVEQDAQLLALELRRSGFAVTYERVDTHEAMAAALDKQVWDVVISDYALPRFSAPMALALLQAKQLDVPFIIVSGTVNEDIAIESIHAGAQDFMAKGKLVRLVPSIERELRAATLRAEQKRMHHQLMISDRMAAMGTLAAGVAHEINNPLACAVANLDLALTDLTELAQTLGLASKFKAVTEELQDARDATERIRNIVRDLKIFSRCEEDKLGPVDVERVLESTLRMAWNEIRHRCRLIKDYGKIPAVKGGESRLGQVFLNLVVNAAQAIPEGQADSNEIRVSTYLEPNGKVAIEFADTGVGIPPEVMSNLFVPFVTTKASGMGTGLGLSICHRIVTDFGGSIKVETQIGKGTTFRLSLPAAYEEARTAPPFALQHIHSSRRGKVLVVEDEPMIAKAVERTLVPDHEIVVADSASEALKRIEEGDRFDVILCDLMMPHMTGMDLYTEIANFAEDQASRMIFLTGGAFTNRARAFLQTTAVHQLDKPFDPRDLRSLVNERIR